MINREIDNENLKLLQKLLTELFTQINIFEKNERIIFLIDHLASKDSLEKCINSISGRNQIKYDIRNINNIERERLSKAIYVDCLDDKESDNSIEILNYITKNNWILDGFIFPTGYRLNSGCKISLFIKYNLLIAWQANIGLYLNDCLDAIEHIDILKKNGNDCFHLMDESDMKMIFNLRHRNTNKGDYLKVTIMGGSKEYMGAPVLAYSSLMALALGCGFSYLTIPESLYKIYALRQPQIIVKTFPDIDGHFIFNEKALDKVIVHSDVIVLGMGMGVSIEVYKIIEYLLNNFRGRLVIDADGLNSLAKYGVSILKRHVGDVVITPHIKEFARLNDCRVKAVINDPVSMATEFSSVNDLVVLLKSASSIITDGKKVNVNISGNSSLAKAGSGDLLSGIVGGILSIGEIDTLSAASLASYLLGRVAEDACEKRYEASIIYQNIVDQIGKTMFEIQNCLNLTERKPK